MTRLFASATIAALCLAAPLHAKTVYTDLAAWLAAIPEAPDFTEDFETGFADGDIYTGTGTMTISPGFPIETGAGLSLKIQVRHPRPRGHRMLRWTDSMSTWIARNAA